MVNLAKLTPSAIKQRVMTRQVSLYKGAAEVGIKGTLWSLPFVASTIANGERGQRLSSGLASGVSQLIVQPALSYVGYIGLASLIPGIGEGLLAVGLVSLAVHYPAEFVESRLNRVFKTFRSIDLNTRRLNMGYNDTDRAMSFRQNAIQEMSGAFASSRRYLGNEAIYNHR